MSSTVIDLKTGAVLERMPGGTVMRFTREALIGWVRYGGVLRIGEQATHMGFDPASGLTSIRFERKAAAA